MPTFEFTSPEGKKYSVSGPDGATKEQAFQILQAQISGGTATPDAPAEAAPRTRGTAIEETGRVLGRTARMGIEGAAAGAGAFTDPLIQAFGGAVRGLTGSNYQPATLAGVGQQVANAIGLPSPEGNAERAADSFGRGAVAAATGAGAAGLAANATTGTTRGVLQTLSQAPLVQAGAGGTAALAGEVVRQRGGSEGAQLAATLAGGIAAPLAAVGATRAIRAARTQPVTPQANPAAPPVAPEVATPVAPDALAEMTRTAATGTLGKKGAITDLAEQTFADPKVIASAKRLGIDEHLQADHVTTNQAYRELAQAVKSIPGSEARAAEMQGLQAVAKRASDLVDQYGGTHDLSTLDRNLKSNMQKTVDDLSKQADEAYANLRATIPARAPAPAPTVLAFIEQRAADLDGIKNLSPMEKMIFSKLSPKKAKESETVPGNPLMPGQMTASTRTSEVLKQPTYALLDDVRRDLTAARIQRAGPFKDADTGLIKALELRLKADQREAIGPHGQLDAFDSAQSLVRVRKGIEDDMTALFGKAINGSMVSKLEGAVAALPKGDTSKIINLLQAVPENMRREVVASGLSTAFNVSAKNQQLSFKNYTQFYEGLLKNKQANAAIMTNLPPEARRQLSDLYRVAKGISSATRERITTGRIMAVTQDLKGADSLMANIYGVAKKSMVGLAAEAVTTPLGAPGAGLASGITSALIRGKTDTMKAADKLITSPEFLQAVQRAQTGIPREAAKQFAASRAFREFARTVKNPREIGNPEQWVLSALTADKANKEANKPRKQGTK